ncbi:MAG TPA: hypothetical protein VJ986_13715, partial [Gaiellaceae bacterium]|nr:hypothetical protein [Gaiellaceae bacterium]
HGGAGSDIYDIGLSGQPGPTGAKLTTIDVADAAPASDGGINQLYIYGTEQPDYFLLRANQEVVPPTAMVAAFRVASDGTPILDGTMERVNYDGSINGGLQIYGRGGNDTFVLDDNLAPTTIFGGAGNDTFQIGQLFASPRDGSNPNNGLAPADYFQTTPTTQGYLSNGVSYATTIFGGTGNDSFTVYHNLAELFLYGQQDNDTFVVRAFVKVNPNDPQAPFTNINGGAGADFISYTVDAPVRIDGGDGLDTLVVLGTDFGDTFVVTDKGVFGAGLYITYTGVEKVVVDGQQGNDTFYVQSTSPNVLLQLVGSKGSDTFNIGGGTTMPITVVSNSLQGHSGLVAQMLSSADINYRNLPAQWISTNVTGNDAPGVVISQVSPLIVFENPNAPQAMIQNRYSVVLAQAPSEDVRVVAAPSPLSEQVALAGGKNIRLNGSDTGVTLLFTRANWFLPQTVTVTAQVDNVAEGTRYITIQHTVIQGASPNDGGAYDGIPVAGVKVEVVDANTATVVTTPFNQATNSPENGLLVSEAAATQSSGTLPQVDHYAVVLSKAPTGPVTYQAVSDGSTELSLDGTTWSHTVQLTFDASTWNTMRVVSVRAVDDNIAQGLHFSRITQGIDAADAANLYGLTAADVAAGIAAAVNGDSSGRFHADVSGSTVTVNGPAFTGAITAGGDTLSIDSAASTPALTGSTTFTLSGTPTPGEVWKLTLNGADFAYGAQQGDGLDTIATALATSVGNGGSFTATATGTTLTVTPVGSAPYTAVLTTSSTSAPIAATTSTPATCPASAPQTCEWSSLVLHVSIPGQVQPQQAWALSLNTGTSAASAVTYTYVAGQNGETTLLAPLTAKVADNNAPGVLVLQPTGSTNLIEPSQFVVLGDGFVSSFLSSCPVTGSTAVTCFTGDFGTSTVNESGFHATLASAQNLELASWGLNADPNIVNATTIPHVTVQGTGDGNSDFYKFTVTQAMIDASSGAVQTTFDIDHGYTAGDPIVWLSKLRLYNQAGNLVAQGPGYSNPYTQGAGGSTTWFDDFLQTSLSTPGTYTVEVGSWLYTTGLPSGVNYDLQVSVQQHPVAGFVFAPAPVQENETGNNTTPQSVDSASNWYTFFNSIVGDQGGTTGGSIDSSTPYVQIAGSGDGSYDLYSFTVTPGMISPQAGTIDTSGSTAAPGPFYTSVGLTLNGTVSAGDVWQLGIGTRDLSYTAGAGDGLVQVAQGLASQLGPAFTANVSTNASGQVVLTIANPDGFSLSGQTVNGLMQLVSSAGTVTRTATSVQSDGTTPIDFTNAAVTLTLPPTKTLVPGDTWTITADGFSASHIVTTADTLTTLAGNLANQLAQHFGGGSATASGATVTLANPAGFQVAVSVRGANPTGAATIAGTPQTGEATSVAWSSETLSIPTASVLDGETWHLTLGDAGTGANPLAVQATASATGDATGLASALATAIDGNGGYSATASNGDVTITRGTPFSSTAFTIDPSGSIAVDPTVHETRTVTIASTLGETGTWTVTLANGSTQLVSASYESNAADTAATIAGELASQLQGPQAHNSVFRVTRTGAVLTITRTDAGADFSATVGFAPHASVSGQTTAAHVVTIPTPTNGDSFRLTVGTSGSSWTTGADAGAIASTLAGWANGLTGYAASSSAAGAEITIISLTGAASFAVTLERKHTDTSTNPATTTTTDITPANDTTENGAVFDFTGPVVTGEIWSAGGKSFTAATNVLGDVISGLAGSFDATVATYIRGTKLALASASAFSTGAGVTVLADTAAGDVVGAAQATRIATLSAPVNTGDDWTLSVAGDATPATVTVASSSATSADAVASRLAASSAYPSGYTVTSDHSTIYVTATDPATTTFALAGAIARHATGNGSLGGTPVIAWQQTVALAPAGDPQIALGDQWSITVGGTTSTVQVSGGSASAGWQFNLGASNVTLPVIASATTVLATALADAIGTPQATVSNGTLVVANPDGTPLSVGQVTEQRLGAALTPPSASGNSATVVSTGVHYTTAVIDLVGTVTPVWQSGETWTLTVNGQAYTYTATGAAPTHPLESIAAGLAAAFTTANGSSPLHVTASGSTLTITDTTSGSHPFTAAIARGGNGVKAAINLANANTVSGSVSVPVVLPGYQWLVAAYPWFAPYFSIADSLGYTATPVFQLLDSSQSVLASSIPGSPYLDYTFTTAGTYTVRVGAYVQWNATTTYLHVANTFHPLTETTGVTNGISYTLDISVQRHATNQQAVTLDGKTITIISGPGAGQTATITHYDPQHQTYTLDRKWATAPGPGSKFEISQSTSSLPGYQPVTDSYQVVLTSQPTATVYVAVSPQPTPTYNAAQAFDPAANYGQNNQVQVRVKTPRALFLLTGTPAAGETWTILLNDQAFSYRVTGSGDLSLAAIAQKLAGVIDDAAAGYTATIDPNNPDQLVVESAAAFYSGFRVSHDLAGGATVTPAPAAGATIAFSGTPADGEVWTLTLDGTPYRTTAAAGESLAAIVAQIVSRLPATYTTNVAGTVLTVSRDATGTPLTASVSVGAPTVGTITASLVLTAGYGRQFSFSG